MELKNVLTFQNITTAVMTFIAVVTLYFLVESDIIDETEERLALSNEVKKLRGQMDDLLSEKSKNGDGCTLKIQSGVAQLNRQISNRGKVSISVDFDKKFTSKPTVFVGLSALTVHLDEKGWAATDVRVADEKTKGFTLTFSAPEYAFKDAEANWFAYGC